MHRDESLWLAGLGTFLVGDMLTTTAGLSLGLAEMHPVGQTLLNVAGPTMLLLPKALVCLVLLALYDRVNDSREEWAVGIPLGLVLAGVSLTAWNSLLIATVVT